MTLMDAVVLGAVEGIAEFLPISSTGHLILAEHLLGLPQTEFLKSFSVAVQLGAILAAAALYAKTLLTSWQILLRVGIAFLPTAAIGLLLHDVIRAVFLGNDAVVTAALAGGGVALIAFERWYRPPPTAHGVSARMPLANAFLIGLGQSLALLPGVSRSAATVVAGLLLGMDRKAVVEFSFLLAIPTMAAATGLDLLTSRAGFTGQEWGLLAVGTCVAFGVALVAIRWLLSYVQHHTFTAFGVYRIALAAVYAVFFLA